MNNSGIITKELSTVDSRTESGTALEEQNIEAPACYSSTAQFAYLPADITHLSKSIDENKEANDKFFEAGNKIREEAEQKKRAAEVSLVALAKKERESTNRSIKKLAVALKKVKSERSSANNTEQVEEPERVFDQRVSDNLSSMSELLIDGELLSPLDGLAKIKGNHRLQLNKIIKDIEATMSENLLDESEGNNE